MFYNDPLSLYPMSFVNPNQKAVKKFEKFDQDMYMNMFQCGISEKISRLNDITYYTDNIPVVSLNEDKITIVHDQPKNKLTIYDLNRLIFPFDPIRDWVEKKTKEINEKYTWVNSL